MNIPGDIFSCDMSQGMVLHVPVSRKWRICSLAGPGTFMPVRPVAGLQQLHVEPWLSRTCLSSERVTLQLRDNSFQTLGNKCSRCVFTGLWKLDR